MPVRHPVEDRGLHEVRRDRKDGNSRKCFVRSGPPVNMPKLVSIVVATQLRTDSKKTVEPVEDPVAGLHFHSNR